MSLTLPLGTTKAEPSSLGSARSNHSSCSSSEPTSSHQSQLTSRSREGEPHNPSPRSTASSAEQQPLSARMQRRASQPAPVPQVILEEQKRTFRLFRSSVDESFGLVLSTASRVVVVDENGAAAVAGVLPLDHVLLVDKQKTSALLIAEQVSGKLSITLTLVRPLDRELSSIAAVEGLASWTRWEKAIVACAKGEMAEMLDALHELMLLTNGEQTEEDIVATRLVTAQEASAIHATYGLTITSSVTLDRIAFEYGHHSLHQLLEQAIHEAMAELTRTSINAVDIDLTELTTTPNNPQEPSQEQTCDSSRSKGSTGSSRTYHSAQSNAASTPRSGAASTPRSGAGSTPRSSGGDSDSAGGSFRTIGAHRQARKANAAAASSSSSSPQCLGQVPPSAFAVAAASGDDGPGALAPITASSEWDPPPFVPLHQPRSPLRAPDLERWGGGSSQQSSLQSSAAQSPCSTARSTAPSLTLEDAHDYILSELMDEDDGVSA